MWREKAGFLRGGDEVGIQTQHDIGVRFGALKLYAGQKRRAIARAGEYQITGAFGLESLFDRGAGPPFGNETVIGQHVQHRSFRMRHGGGSQETRSKEEFGHLILHLRRAEMERAERPEPSLRRS